MPSYPTGGSFPEPAGNTEEVQPIPERSYAPVFPYRGVEQHGVPVENQPWIPQDANEATWDGAPEYQETPVPIEPIPVVIVNENQREIRSWRAYTASVRKNESVLIVGQNPRMTRVLIKVVAVSNDDRIVSVSHEGNVNLMNGFPILPGETLEISTEEEVYAILNSSATDGDSIDVYVLLETTVG